MKARFYAVVHLLHAMIDRRYAVLLRFAKAQTEMVMIRDQKKHYILSPEERQRPLSLGAEIDHAVKDELVIVSWQTYKRWIKDANAGKEPGRVSHPRTITQEIWDLILQLAQENNRWGKKRISETVRDIGEIPEVENPERKESCRYDLAKFIMTYAPEGKNPFSEDHLRVIKRIEHAIFHGGRFVEAVYTVTRQQTEAEYVAVRARRGDDVGTVAELPLPWDTVSRGSPADQIHLPGICH